MPLICALETATATATVSIARIRSGAVRLWWDWESDSRNLQTSIFSALEGGFKALYATPNDTNVVIVGTGPGSFTGVKLGLGFAKTTAQLAPECKLYGVPSWLGAIPADLEPDIPVAWTVPSTRKTSYLIVVQIDAEGNLEELLPLADHPHEEIAGLLEEVAESGFVLREPASHLPEAPDGIVPSGWEGEPVEPRHATALLELFMEIGEEWNPDDPFALTPEYVRPPQATMVRRPRIFES